MRISDWSSVGCSSDLLVAGIDAVGPSPHAYDQVHRDQSGFEEDVEQEQVLRRETADHQRFHDQECGHVFAHAAGYRLQTGRASGRARVCQYFKISVGAVSLKKKTALIDHVSRI